MQVEEEDDLRLRLSGRLEDIRLGEPLHVIEVEMLISLAQAQIVDVQGRMVQVPLADCAGAISSLASLVGVTIVPGFSDFVRTTIGGPQGCTHLATLLMNMGNTSVQGRGAMARKMASDEGIAREVFRSQANQLGLIDSCISWREGGPLATRLSETRRREAPDNERLRLPHMSFSAKAPICLNCVHFSDRHGCSEGYCELRRRATKEYSPACEDFHLFT
ncbi:MAG: DUF2889 domain-containing protein [Candidatus Geothermincolia bacterium]